MRRRKIAGPTRPIVVRSRSAAVASSGSSNTSSAIRRISGTNEFRRSTTSSATAAVSRPSVGSGSSVNACRASMPPTASAPLLMKISASIEA